MVDIVPEICPVAQFLKGRDNALLPNVTAHVGVHVSSLFLLV